jgi:hypothetical protein
MPPSTHSKLSPSSASTWSKCTASIAFTEACRQSPDPAIRKVVANAERGSIYADEGTQAHDYAEQILLGKLKEKDLPKDFAPVLDYTRLCQTLANRWEGQVLVETKVPLFYFPQDTGTVDHAIISPEMICVTDLKYGIGVPVEAEHNEQLAIYAYSLILNHPTTFPDSTPVEIRICQPRYSGGETEKLWQLTIGELRASISHVTAAADVILNGPEAALDFAPDFKTCRWCKAKEVCHVRAAEPLARIDPKLLDAFECELELVDTIDIPVLATLTQQQILGIHQRSEELIGLIEGCAKYLHQQAMEGNPVRGTKLVEGRQGNRAWADEESAVKAVKGLLSEDQLFTRKLVSPTQVAKLLKDCKVPKEILTAVDALTVRANGKPVLALSGDKRPAIPAPTEGFTTTDDQD